MDAVIEPIRVWPFHSAPAELRALSHHGGDEDWLALLPPTIDYPEWMNDGTAFGWCSVSWHDHPTAEGWRVAIGAHS